MTEYDLYNGLLNIVISFFTLMITGRIYTFFSSEIKTTWKEDAQASALISGIVLVVYLFSILIPELLYIIPLVYIGLIYMAFQLNGIIDLIFFYVLYRLIFVILHWLLIITLGNMPTPPVRGDGFGGGISNPPENSIQIQFKS